MQLLKIAGRNASRVFVAAAVIGFLWNIAPASRGAEGLPAPSDLRVRAESGSHFVLSWRDNSADENGFRIERKPTYTDQWHVVGETPANVRTYYSVGCTEQTPYDHRVSAFRHAAEGDAVDESDTVINEGTATLAALPKRQGTVLCPVSRDNPRNGEGDFIKLRDGRLLYAWSHYRGPGDLDPCDIAFCTSADDGVTWSRERIVLSEGDVTLAHPGLVRLSSGELGMSYIRITGKDSAQLLFRRSPDEGGIWSEPVHVTHDQKDYATGPHASLRRLSNGQLLQVAHCRRASGPMSIHIYISADDGDSWVDQTPEGLQAPDDSGQEGSVAELGAGKLLLYFRTRTGWFFESRSDDFGRTWSQPTRAAVRGGQSPAKLYNLPNSPAIALVWCSFVRPGVRRWPSGERWILASMVSQDGGLTWRNYKQIEYTGGLDWYHYPNVYFSEGFAHIAYHFGDHPTRHHEESVYQRLRDDWFMR